MNKKNAMRQLLEKHRLANGIVVGLAPMYEVNDIAFRKLLRDHYNVKLCWTGMVNSKLWVERSNIRNRLFSTTENDSPLIIQISGSDINYLEQTAKDLEPFGDAIEINFGCTQHIAKRGQYGYFMVNTEEKRKRAIEICKHLSSVLKIPFSVKLRIISNEDDNPCSELTCEFAKQLEEAGISMLTIHGRRKNSNKSGEVDTDTIKLVAENLKIPVFANGGVTSMEEAVDLIKKSNAFGVVVGQGLLTNPALFSSSPEYDPVKFSRQYMELFKVHPYHEFVLLVNHIFYFFKLKLASETNISEKLKKAKTYEAVEAILNDLEIK